MVDHYYGKINDYKFYKLTEEEHLILEQFGANRKLTHVFICGELSFKKIISLDAQGNKPILFLLENCYWKMVDGKCLHYDNPDKFEKKITNLKVCKFVNTPSTKNVAQVIDLENDLILKLCSKISYFHDLIFYIREVCKNEVPEDVIKYILTFV